MPHTELDLVVFYYKLAVREMERITQGRVKIVIVHRNGTALEAMTPDATLSGLRLTGAEIVSAWLIFRGKQYQLKLGSPHLIVFDYLCWHCAGGIGQSAAEVEAGLNEQLFYVHHASSAERQHPVLARASRTNIRKVVERIRKIMADLFARKHLPLDPRAILRSEPTSTREIRYSIWADVSWEN